MTAVGDDTIGTPALRAPIEQNGNVGFCRSD
jgi:hypothetical protein